jgi:uncharacterized protein
MTPGRVDDGFGGRGWAFPVTLDGDVMAAEAGDAKIRQSIALILATRKGERVMRPEFGCGIHDLVWASPTPATLAAAADAVRHALLRFEPRITVDRVDIVLDPSRPAALRVQLTYTVRRTNSTFNLVYPFALET